MRTLHPARLELIDALVAETALGGITAGLLEKDEHLTDALRALLALPLDGLSLAFCGGTSLSKAHGLIKHLSEDADLKIVLPTDAQALFKTQLRKRMSELKRALLSLIYGNSTPEFNEAFAGFERVALAFLASLQKPSHGDGKEKS
ncbi:MAG: nucleotidyl transferase AbiEii/AbiGii toxin family protein [Polaromonas sp.]